MRRLRTKARLPRPVVTPEVEEALALAEATPVMAAVILEEAATLAGAVVIPEEVTLAAEGTPAVAAAGRSTYRHLEY